MSQEEDPVTPFTPEQIEAFKTSAESLSILQTIVNEEVEKDILEDEILIFLAKTAAEASMDDETDSDELGSKAGLEFGEEPVPEVVLRGLERRKHITHGGEPLELTITGAPDEAEVTTEPLGEEDENLPPAYRSLVVQFAGMVIVTQVNDPSWRTQYDYWRITERNSEYDGSIVIVGEEADYFKDAHPMTDEFRKATVKVFERMAEEAEQEGDEINARVCKKIAADTRDGRHANEGEYLLRDNARVLDSKGVESLTSMLLVVAMHGEDEEPEAA